MNETTPGAAFLGLELSVEVWLAREKVLLEQLLELQPGGVLPLSHDPDGPVDLVVNGSIVASGELVVVDGKFGFRVTSSAQQKLANLDTGAGGGSQPAAAAEEPAAAPAAPPSEPQQEPQT